MDEEKLFDEYDSQVGVAVDSLIAAKEADDWGWEDWWKSERSFLAPGDVERKYPKPKPPPTPTRQLNELFKDGAAERGESFIRDRLREVSFDRQILPPLKAADLSGVGVLHGSLVRIVEIEPDSRAMAIMFRGRTPSRIRS